MQVSEIRHKTPVGAWDGGFAPGPDPERGDYASFADFADPDGNTWVLQERGFPRRPTPKHRRSSDSELRHVRHWRPSPSNFAAAAAANGLLLPLLTLDNEELSSESGDHPGPAPSKGPDGSVSDGPLETDASSGG